MGAALIMGSFFSQQLFSQGTDCSNANELGVSETWNTTSHTFSSGQCDIYISFYAVAEAAFFSVESFADIPEKIYLYDGHCSALLDSQTYFIDSTTVGSLSLSYYDLVASSTYTIRISRANASSSSSFDLGAMNYTLKPTCLPSPCPVSCNKLYNGSFETALAMPSPTYWHRNIDFSKGWIKPNHIGSAADYFHSGSSDPGSDVPNNYFGSYPAVNSVAGDDAYAGLFALYGTDIHSVLEVCGNTMWKGIRIVGSGSNLILSNSEIWEAEKAINSTSGGNFAVSNTLFDGNFLESM